MIQDVRGDLDQIVAARGFTRRMLLKELRKRGTNEQGV